MSKLLSRRRFIEATAVTLAGVSSCPVAAAESDIGKHIYKSLKWNMIKIDGSVREKFQLLKQLGYDGVELNSPDQVDKQEALKASRETGLPIEGLVNATHWKVRHSDPDPGVRQRALEDMKTALRDAALVGADSVLLVPGKVTDPERENHDQVWSRSLAAISQLMPLAEKLKVRILIENVGNGFCKQPKQFAQYIDEIKSPWFGVHFDIGNHISYAPPAEWIRTLGTRIRKLDVKDREKDKRPLVPIGQGDSDWSEVRQALVEVGYRGWAAAEVSGGDSARLTKVLKRMNDVLGNSDGMPARDLPGATKNV